MHNVVILRMRTGWSASTECLTSSECAADPGMLLKSPATSIGMSALAAIFSSPLTSVCTWQTRGQRNCPSAHLQIQAMSAVLLTQMAGTVTTQLSAAYLPQLHVVQLWVGVDVRVGDADQGPAAAAAAALGLRRLQRLQHSNQRHIVLHTVG
jgi:hypothetical protein